MKTKKEFEIGKKYTLEQITSELKFIGSYGKRMNVYGRENQRYGFIREDKLYDLLVRYKSSFKGCAI